MYNISYNVKVTLISLVFIKADFDSGQIARIIEKALWSNQVSRSFDFHFLKNSKFFSTYQSKLPIFRRHFCFLYCPISRDSKFTLWAVSRKNLTHAALATQHKISHSRKGKIAKKKSNWRNSSLPNRHPKKRWFYRRFPPLQHRPSRLLFIQSCEKVGILPWNERKLTFSRNYWQLSTLTCGT